MSASIDSAPKGAVREYQDGYVQVSFESEFSSLLKTSMYLGSACVLLVIASIGMVIFGVFGEGATTTDLYVSIGCLVVTVLASIVFFVKARKDFSANKDELARRGIH